MSSNSCLYTTVGVALAALLSSCSTPAPPGRVVLCDAKALERGRLPTGPALSAQIPESFTPIPLDQVTFVDADMTRWLMVQSVSAGRSPTQTVEVMTRVVNCSNDPVQIEGRTHFLDIGQRPTEQVSAWRRVMIPPRSIGVYQETSVKTAEVSNYLIELRNGR